MTLDRAAIRVRLAAGLDDALSIEERPIDEVRAELALLGIDPGPSIRLAEKLAAAKADDPATRLLGRLEDAEAIDAEIAALEHADIDEVRASLPPDLAAATGTNETDMEPTAKVVRWQRRRAMLGWGGSLAGIAASVLLFIAVRPDRLEEATPPVSSVEQRQPEIAAADLAETAVEKMLPRSEMAASADRSPADSTVGGREQASADDARVETVPHGVRALDKAPPALSLADEAVSSAAPRSAATARLELQPEMATDERALGGLTGVLVVEPGRASPALVALARAQPGERLAARIDDARSHLPGRRIVALVTFLRAGEEVQAALVERVDDQERAREAPASSLDKAIENQLTSLAAPDHPLNLIELP